MMDALNVNKNSSGFRSKFRKLWLGLTVRKFVFLILSASAVFFIGAFVVFNINFTRIVNQNIQKDMDDFVADSRGIFSRVIERFTIATETIARDRTVQGFIDNPDPAVDVRTIISRQKVAFLFDNAFLLSGSGQLLFSDTPDDSFLKNASFQRAIERSRDLKSVQATIIDSPVYQKPLIFIFHPILGREKNGVIIFGKVMDEEFLKKLFPVERRGVFFFNEEKKISSANIYDTKTRRAMENSVQDIFSQHSEHTEKDISKIVKEQDFSGNIVASHLLQASFPVGNIGFFIDEAEFFQAQKTAIITNIIVTISIGLVFFVTLLFMGRFVVRPLAGLAEGFSKIEQNDFSTRLVPFGLADVRGIMEGFNGAMRQVSNKTQQLSEAAIVLGEKNKEAEKNYLAMMNVLEDAKILEKNLEKSNYDVGKQKERAENILGFLRSIGDSVIATDLEGKITFFNEAAEKITGIPESEALGKFSTDVLFVFNEKNLKVRRYLARETLEGKPDEYKISDRFVVKNRNGAFLPIVFSAALIYNAQKRKQGAIMVIRDAAEEREIEKTKDNFLSVAAHQLRTPLSGIRWNLEMLLDGDAGKLPKDAKEVVENINENNLRLVNLVNDLLNVSRINLGKVTEPSKAVGVVETISAVLKSGDGLVSKKNIIIEFDPEKNQDLQVFISPERLFESIENIISNALKYAAEKDGKVKIAVVKNQDKVRISIADNGIGIPKREQEKMFSKFFRAENAVQKDPEGSGLGLSVVKSFIEEAKGEVSFESEEGKGTTFFIDLPICSGANPAEAEKNASAIGVNSPEQAGAEK